MGIKKSDCWSTRGGGGGGGTLNEYAGDPCATIRTCIRGQNYSEKCKT